MLNKIIINKIITITSWIQDFIIQMIKIIVMPISNKNKQMMIKIHQNLILIIKGNLIPVINWKTIINFPKTSKRCEILKKIK